MVTVQDVGILLRFFCTDYRSVSELIKSSFQLAAHVMDINRGGGVASGIATIAITSTDHPWRIARLDLDGVDECHTKGTILADSIVTSSR